MKSETTMSSMSHDSGRYRNHICHCGIESPIVTSWSISNPGRRFFGCGNYGKSSACNFFEWFDPPMQPEATGTTSIILGLLRKVDRIEREKERAMEREREKEREMQREREMEKEKARERARNDTWNTLLFILVIVIIIGFMMIKV